MDPSKSAKFANASEAPLKLPLSWGRRFRVLSASGLEDSCHSYERATKRAEEIAAEYRTHPDLTLRAVAGTVRVVDTGRG